MLALADYLDSQIKFLVNFISKKILKVLDFIDLRL